GVLFAQNRKQVVEVERAVDERFTGADMLAFLNVDVGTARDSVFLGRLAVFAFHVDLAHALGDVAVADGAVDFGNDGGVFGLAGFEKLHDARETTGDVLGFGGFARDLREHVSGLDFIAILHHQVRTGRHEVLLADLAGRIADQDSRLMLFVARRQRDDKLREAGDFVNLFLNREAGAEIVEFHRARRLGKDREGEGIPFREDLALVDGVAVFDAQTRAINDVVALLFPALVIEDDDEPGAIHGDARAATALDVTQVNELHVASVLCFEGGTLADAGSRATDVEGTHGELRAGFADGLRGDDADGFAHFDHAAGGQVAAIAERANTAPGFAGEHGTDAHALNT